MENCIEITFGSGDLTPLSEPAPPVAQRLPANLVQRSPLLQDVLGSSAVRPAPVSCCITEDSWKHWMNCALHGIPPDLPETDLMDLAQVRHSLAARLSIDRYIQ